MTSDEPPRDAANRYIRAAAPDLVDQGSSAIWHLIRILSYEDWRLRGMPAPGPANEPPPYYFDAESCWGDSFEFVRSTSVGYVSRVLSLVPWIDLFESVYRRVANEDPAGAAELVVELQQGLPKFNRQYRQAVLGMVWPTDTPDESFLRSALASFATAYEVDMPLWFMGVLAQAHMRGRINSSFCGGASSTTAQGAVLVETEKLIVGTPFEEGFTSTYCRSLRNAIGHNDYDIRCLSNGDLVVVQAESNEQWSAGEIFWRMEQSYNLVSSARLAIEMIVAGSRYLPSDAGVVTATLTTGKGVGSDAANYPVVILSQLVQLRDLDPTGGWIDRSSVTIEIGSDGLSSFFLSDHVSFGRTVPSQVVVEAIEARGWVEVHRFPVAPNLELGLPTVESQEGASYEVVGPFDRHFIPIVVVRP